MPVQTATLPNAVVKEQDVKITLPDEELNVFIDLFEHVRDAQFEIGDRMIHLVAALDVDRTALINELAGRLHVSASTLYDYYRISEKWCQADREIYQSLDWTIYRNADPNNPDDRELLDQCIDEGWNASRFKEEKYPAMKDPENVIGRLRSLIEKHKGSFPARLQARLEGIEKELTEILGEL